MKRLTVFGTILKRLFGMLRTPSVKEKRSKEKPIKLTSSSIKLSQIDLAGGLQLKKNSIDYPLFMREIAIMPQLNKAGINKILSPLGVGDWIYMKVYHKYYSQ